MATFRLITEGLYVVLQYVNLALAVFALYFYIKGARLSQRGPWKNLKWAFSFNMMMSTLIYVSLLLGQQVEPLFIRVATSLLLASLAVSAYLGVNRHGTTDKG